MSDILQQRLKAVFAALLSFLATWSAARFPAIGQILTPEVQATIVGLITGFVVHQVPNKPVTS